jgi:hypothetical protein
VGVEVVENDMKLAIRKGGNHTIHEAEKLDAAPPLRMRSKDLSGGDFERRKQGRGAVQLVLVALAGQGASVRELQIALPRFNAWIDGFSSTQSTIALAGGLM